MTDDQLQEFAEKYRCSHPGCVDWFDMTVDKFTNIARAIEQTARLNALEEAANAIEPRNPPGDWTDYAKVRAEAAAAIRALSKEQQ